VFLFRPMQLARYLEEVWTFRDPVLFDEPTELEVPFALVGQEGTSGVPLPVPPLVWKHLIYAYMIENTRAYEIFGRVVAEYAFGERLGTPSNETQRWLRTTEQLFYAPDAPFQIHSFTSYIRNDPRSARRNAYHRMFGTDLNHGTDDGRPYPYPRAPASNSDFASTWEQLLREVWRGFENERNAVGPSPVDNAAIATLCRRLDDMLSVRREGGNLNREELAYTATMSWFHLTLSFNSAVVLDLEAQAEAPEDRLLKLGERVGLPAHSRSAAYFRLADNMAFILRMIENGQFNNDVTAETLYELPPPGQSTEIRDAMQANIRDWSIATGRDMKSRPVSVEAPAPRPVRPPPRPIAPTTTSNGRGQITRETLPV
jgi:hypothetical protein